MIGTLRVKRIPFYSCTHSPFTEFILKLPGCENPDCWLTKRNTSAFSASVGSPLILSHTHATNLYNKIEYAKGKASCKKHWSAVSYDNRNRENSKHTHQPHCKIVGNNSIQNIYVFAKSIQNSASWCSVKKGHWRGNNISEETSMQNTTCLDCAKENS